jgi:hypothetical protein
VAVAMPKRSRIVTWVAFTAGPSFVP